MGGTIGGMATHPPDSRIVHPLPSAPQFVGRRTELDELLASWYSGLPGVVALVGLGGAGKTAIASRFVDELCRPDNPYRPEGLFVWSFYQEPDAGFFLSEAYRYFAGVGADPAVSGRRGPGSRGDHVRNDDERQSSAVHAVPPV